MNKRIIGLFFALVIILSLAGCSFENGKTQKIAETKIDIGESEIFSEKDRKSAAEFILNKWKNEPTITKLYSITYAGDEESKYEQEYYYDLGEGYSYEEMIVFYISFRTAKGAESEGFESNEDYDGWSEILGRNNGGEWVFVTGGYG